MGGWLSASGAIAVAVAILLLPGLLFGLALRLRGLALWALAPAASIVILTGVSLLTGLAGIPWRPWVAVTGAVVVAAIAFAVCRVLRLGRVPVEAKAGSALVWTGIAIGAALTTARIGLYIGAPDAISQTNDASFHLSALRFAVETGLASPLQLAEVIGASTFYPSAWHVVAALVAQVAMVPVEVAANVTSLAIVAIAWPLGIGYLARATAGPVAGAVAAALSTALTAYPLVMIQWGVLYPQLLAVALLPAALACLVDRKGLFGGHGSRGGRITRVVVLSAIGPAAIALAQPSVLLAWCAGALALAIWQVIAVAKALAPRGRALAVAGLVVAAAATALLWWFFGRSVGVGWPPTTGKATAVLEVLTGGMLGYPWAVGVSILALIGIAASLRRRELRWIATLWALLALLYVVAAAIGSPALRGLLVGPWYEDPYRLAALLPVAVLPLAGAGAAVLVSWATRAIGARRATAQWTAIAVVGAIGVVSVAVAPQIARRDVFAHRIDPNLYSTTAESFLSVDELTLLRRLDVILPADAVIIGNPSTGMAFGYSVSGMNVIPRTWTPPSGAAYATLWTSLRDVEDDPAVCSALEQFGARYVLDFGAGEVYPGRWIMPGFTGLAGQPGFELVDQEGEASLWRVTACD